MTIRFKRGHFCVLLILDWWSFRFGIMFPHFGFECFYLSRDICTLQYESGYRFFSEGLADVPPWTCMRIWEQWRKTYDWYEMPYGVK